MSTNQPTKITDEQIDRLFTQLRLKILNSDISSESIQKVLDQEKLIKLQGRVIHLLEHVAEIASVTANSSIIQINYDEPDAVAKAIEAGEFEDKSIKVRNINDIPLDSQGLVRKEVLEFPLGCLIPEWRDGTYRGGLYLHNPHITAALEDRGLVWADPLTALTYAAQFPDRQRKAELCVVFRNNDEDKNLCYLFLDKSYEKRRLKIDYIHPHEFWFSEYHFLVARKQQ